MQYFFELISFHNGGFFRIENHLQLRKLNVDLELFCLTGKCNNSVVF